MGTRFFPISLDRQAIQRQNGSFLLLTNPSCLVVATEGEDEHSSIPMREIRARLGTESVAYQGIAEFPIRCR